MIYTTYFTVDTNERRGKSRKPWLFLRVAASFLSGQLKIYLVTATFYLSYNYAYYDPLRFFTRAGTCTTIFYRFISHICDKNTNVASLPGRTTWSKHGRAKSAYSRSLPTFLSITSGTPRFQREQKRRVLL